MGHNLAALFALLLAGMTASTSALAANRVALVIGNSAYTVAPLKNPVNDAALMARTLAGLGFDVIHENDLDLRGMKRAVRTLTERIGAAGEGAVGLFYYSGHGVETGGTNYFVPVDATIATAADIPIETLSANDVMAAIDAAPNSFNIIIFDACRNDPFRALFRSQSRGLAKMDAPQGSILAYSTSPGSVAEDGVGDNSVYTAALAAAMQEPGVQVEAMFKKVRIAVKGATGGKQLPWETTSLLGDFTFTDPLPPASSDPQPVPTTLDPGADWTLVKDTNNVKVLEGFLVKYGQDPIYGPLAEERIALLTAPAPAPSVPDAGSGAGECSGDGALLVAVADRRDCLKPGDMFRDFDGGPEMVVVPAGKFMMGSPEGEVGRENNEGPRHEVTIREPFAVGKFEVTFDEWRACVADGGCASNRSPDDENWGKGRRPVINVSWNDAQEYVKWLSGKSGKTYRLLSEAEWEYAARAGTSTPFSFGETVSSFHANHRSYEFDGEGYREDFRMQTVEVHVLSGNNFGIIAMHGNVWEWVEDCMTDSYEDSLKDPVARLSTNCHFRVLRGGGWASEASALRSAARASGPHDLRDLHTGIRIARTLIP